MNIQFDPRWPTTETALAKDIKNGQVFEDTRFIGRPRDPRNFYIRLNMGTSSAIQAMNLSTGLLQAFEPNRVVNLHPNAKVVIDDVSDQLPVQPDGGQNKAQDLGETSRSEDSKG